MSTAGGGGGGIVPVLDAAAVTKTYRTGVVEVPALRAIDLRVERGEMVGWRCGLASDRWCPDRSGLQRVRDFRTPVGAAPDSAPAAAGEDRGPPRVEGSQR